MKKHITLAAAARRVVCAIAATAASAAFAVEVTPYQAETAVRNWIRRNPRPMTAQFTSGDGEARTFSEDGKALFHVVQLDGGGFVVTSGDTKVSPIIAFSDDGEFDSSEANPLVSVLRMDLSARAKAVQPSSSASSGGGQIRAAAASSAEKTSAEKEWDDLLETEPSTTGLRRAAASSTGTPDSKMSDIRVAPLLKTKWSQSEWGDCTDIHVYNRFTPNNYVCGCVATAGAQIMKYWVSPTESVTAGTYSCKVDGSTQNLKMKGGKYDWANMPLSYEETPNISTKQIEAIGKLTYDIGVAAGMVYTSEQSGTGQLPFADNMRTIFGYSSSMLYNCSFKYDNHIRADEQLFNAVFASIDAGCPVAVGVFGTNIGNGSNGGHFIVFDGYGYYNSTDEYVHINFGWSGSCNMWYNVMREAIDSSRDGPPYFWHTIGCVCYNIHPTEAGDVISGRVLDSSGRPVANATVKLSGGGISTVEKKSDAKGMWHFRVSKAVAYEIAATIDSRKSKTAVVQMVKGVSGTNQSSGIVGNKWGVDLTLESESEVIQDDPVLTQVEAPVFSPASGSFTSSSLSVTLSCGTSGATIYYTKNGTTPTTASTKYTGAVQITSTTTFKAIAVKSGMANSDVATKTYTKQSKPTITAAQGMDWSGTVTTSSSTAVYGQDEITHDGVDATTLQQSTTTYFPTAVTVSTSVNGPGVLSFWWAGDSKSFAFSYFSLLIDGTQKAERGVGTVWKKVLVPLAAGNHTIQWEVDASIFGYAQGFSSVSGFLDEVSFTPYSGGTCKVVFDGNGATGSTPSTIFAAFADSVKLPDCGALQKDGCVFLGWATSSDTTKVEYFSGSSMDVLAQTTRLYAVWKKTIVVLTEIPQGGGETRKALDSCYGNYLTAYVEFPDWADNFKMESKTSSGTQTFNLGNGQHSLGVAGGKTLVFSASANDTAEDRSFDFDMDAIDYPYVIRFHIMQKGDSFSDKPKGLAIEGASSVLASGNATFSSQVVRRNGAVDVVSPTWSVVSGGSYASVDSSGKLTAKNVSSPQTVVLRASYTESGIPCTAEREVKILPTCDLNTALDNDSLTFKTGTGGNAWSGQFDVSRDGVDAVRAASALGGTPYVRTTVEGPAVVSFDCMISADDGNTLYFVDNGRTNTCAFSVANTVSSWQHKRFTLKEEGAHVVELVYAHDGGPTGVAGADAAWVDSFAITHPATYDVVYEPDGYCGESRRTTAKIEDEALTLEGAIFTREGYTQTGWAKTSGGKKAFDLGATYNDNAPVTLYPFWSANQCSVTLDRQGGSGGTASVTATYGSAMPKITIPTKSGCSFGGYWTEPNGEGTQYYTAAGASAHDWDRPSGDPLYAFWTKSISSLSISGPASVESAGTATYTCTATFSDKSTETVAAEWSLSAGASYGTIDPDTGVFTTHSATARRTVTVKASFGGKSATKTVTITARTLASIAISGPDEIASLESGPYSCTAIYSDGTRENVSATWTLSTGGAYASVVKTTGVVTSKNEGEADQIATLRATFGGKAADKAITLLAKEPPAPPAIRYVDATSGGDLNDGLSWGSAMKSIQSAVDASGEGDLILVAEGTYAPILVIEKTVEIRAADGEEVVIDGGGASFCAVLGGYGKLSGIILRNGFSDFGGGAQGGSLEDCVIQDCKANFAGGGAYRCELSRCIVTRCSARIGGGLSWGYAENTVIYDCWAEDGDGSGYSHGGGAEDSTLVGCTVYGCSAASGAGVAGCTVKNSIIWENRLYETDKNGDRKLGNCANVTEGKKTTIKNTCTYTDSSPKPAGSGNLAKDPLFVDAANGDFRLQHASPVKDKASAKLAAGDIDLGGIPRQIGAPDMGAHEVPDGTPVPADYDGDDMADAAYFDVPTATWMVMQSSDGLLKCVQFGDAKATPVPADYDGDGRADFATYSATAKAPEFRILTQAGDEGAYALGEKGATPFAADADNDGAADPCVFQGNAKKPSFTALLGGEGHNAAKAFTLVFGTKGAKPVAGDFDADGNTDFGCYTATASKPAFSVALSGRGWNEKQPLAVTLGAKGSAPCCGDFDGDGVTDFAAYSGTAASPQLYRMFSTSKWREARTLPFGKKGSRAATGDWDGDGAADAAIESQGAWWRVTRDLDVLPVPAP